MDNFPMNRLDFTKMVNTHVHGHSETKYFNHTQFKPEDYYSWNKRTGKVKEPHRNANIQNKIYGIVSHVHAQLREQKQSVKIPPTKSKVIKDTPKQIVSKDQEVQTKLTSSIPESRPFVSYTSQKGNVIFKDPTSAMKTHVVVDNPANKHRLNNIPRVKVLCKHKEQKRLYSTIPPPKETNNFVNQQRVAEVKKQNAFLESMLEDQKRLQRDRKSVAQEIVTVRNQLDLIWGRLNSSLKKLEQNKTLVESDDLESLKKKTKNQKKIPDINREVKNKAV